MSTTLANMTKKEFIELLESIVEKKLLEIIGDPDDGLEIKEKLRKRLLKQKQIVASGERGVLFEDAVERLGFE
jgi:hypothetical protein